MGKKIHEHNRYYAFFRPYVDWCIRHSYRGGIKMEGRENIPTDGSVIFAPNHSNTIMDALVMLQARKGPTVFGARADLFETMGPMLRFFKILPMVRKRDGIRNVVKNIDTMEQIYDTLDNKVPFCMFCEGTHRPKHSLLPVTKGIARIAFGANEKEERRPVYIVPVGIDYGDYFRFRDTCRMKFGEPVNITEFLKKAEDDGLNESETYAHLRSDLYKRISSLITFIDDDERYEARWVLRRHDAPDEESRYDDALAFEKARREARISSRSFGQRTPVLRHILKVLGTIAGLPLWIACGAVCLPQLLIIAGLRLKVKDRAFLNSVRCLIRVALSLGITIPMLDFFYDYAHFVRIYWSDIRLALRPRLSAQYRKLVAVSDEA